MLTGACRYCGQISSIAEDVLTQEEADDRATESCLCIDAEILRKRNRLCLAAVHKLEEVVDENHIDQKELLKKAIRQMADGKIVKIGITTHTGVQYKIDKKGNWNIKFKREQKEVQTEEV